MTLVRRKEFRCVILNDDGNVACTGIQIKLPAGLTREQAVQFVTGVIAQEVSRYAAAEALGLGPIEYNQPNYWTEIVT